HRPRKLATIGRVPRGPHRRRRSAKEPNEPVPFLRGTDGPSPPEKYSLQPGRARCSVRLVLPHERKATAQRDPDRARRVRQATRETAAQRLSGFGSCSEYIASC